MMRVSPTQPNQPLAVRPALMLEPIRHGLLAEFRPTASIVLRSTGAPSTYSVDVLATGSLTDAMCIQPPGMTSPDQFVRSYQPLPDHAAAFHWISRRFETPTV